MREEFKQHIASHFPELTSHKTLVAISGGVDSVVLTHLLHQLDFEIGLAHCNFHLREEASQQDQIFVEDLAKELNCPCFVTHFDTHKEAEKAQESIQLTARRLRYRWFYELSNQYNYPNIATAHHLNDSLENYVMHSIRGTGLKGLLGVPRQTRKVIRPLLPFSKRSLQNEAKRQGWRWREDTSNQKNTYFRNRIRNVVIPLLEKENPNLLSSFQDTLHHLQQSHNLLEDYTALLYKELISERDNFYAIDLDKLDKIPHSKAVLYQLLHPFGFTDWQSVYGLKDAERGKQVFSESHILEKDRNQLLIFINKESINNPGIYIHYAENVVKFGDSILQIEEVEKIGEVADHIAYLDAAKLNFPLSLRLVKNEDRFSPLGMLKSKKVNHFLRDEKVPTSGKKQTWVLCSDEAIVWVVNHRIDERFKITENTKKCLKISCIKM